MGIMLTLFSPAKINFFLRILKKRSDGYHELASLFQTINLGDILSFSLASEDRFTSSETALSWEPSNLIYQALALFRKKSGWAQKVQIHLEKKIPLQAGMGGGSSNAATTLWALNILHGSCYTKDELQQWSAELGSDVPFFFSCGTAYCTGRGEKVRNLAPIPLEQELFIYKPQEGVPTAAVYNRLHHFKCAPLDPEQLLEDFYEKEPFFHNDLEEPAFHLFPKLREYKKMLSLKGLTQATLSGSGSTLFGFPQKSQQAAFPTIQCINRSESSWYQNL